MKRLIITGEMRSGTTFLSHFLNSQNNINVYADFMRSILGYDEYLNKSFQFNEPLNTQIKNRIISSFKAEARLKGLDYSRQFQDKNYTINDILDIAFEKLFTETGSELVGVKRTGYITSICQLLDNNYKIIYLVRDPRDVCFSAKNRFGGFNKYKFLNSWMKSTSGALAINHENFYLLKFEDLIKDKNQSLKELEKFIGIELSSKIDKLNDTTGLDFQDNSSFNDINTLFDEKAVQRYKMIDKKETIYIDAIANEQMIKMGYVPRLVNRKIQIRENFSYYKNIYLKELKNLLKS